MKYSIATLMILALELCGCASNPPPELRGKYSDSLKSESRYARLANHPTARVGTAGGGEDARFLSEMVTRLVASSAMPKRVVAAAVADCPPLSAYASTDEVIICTSTLRHLSNSSELAFVVAHETAHVLLRHGESDQTSEDNAKANLKWLGFVLGPTGLTIAEANAKHECSGLRRIDEFEADFFAIDLMVGAGYNPSGALSYLDLIDRSTFGKGRSFADEQSDRRRRSLQSSLSSTNPDSAVLGVYLFHAQIDKAIVANVDDSTHDATSLRSTRLGAYIKAHYLNETSRPLGRLPWRASDGSLRKDFKWHSNAPRLAWSKVPCSVR